MEAGKKFEEQENIWQEHHEQQGTMIVNLQVEVQEWKEKYQKQGTTAVNREVEVKEWKEKYEKLKGKLATLMGDD